MNRELDTIRQILTPEGVELELHIAGPIARARAWLYDFLVRLVIWLGLVMVLSYFDAMGFGIFMLCSFLLEWFYPILFEVFKDGQTPGKKAGKLVVIYDDGRPVDWNGSFIRNTVRFADFFPFLYGFGVITCMLNKDGKRLGDLAAGTVVVYVDSAKKILASEADKQTGAEPPPLPLTLEEQQAVIEYRLRSSKLTDDRALELAAIPKELTGDAVPENARNRLMRIGNFLQGRQ